MRRKLVFALILLTSGLSESGCIRFWAVGPPCVGGGCPAGSGGQLGSLKQAQNRAAQDGKALADKSAAASQGTAVEDSAGQATPGN
jgi:hypothetical protein